MAHWGNIRGIYWAYTGKMENGMENKMVIVIFYRGYIRVIWGYWKIKWKLLLGV